MSMQRAHTLADTIRRDLAGDPATDWQRNGPRLTAIVQELVEPKKQVYDRIGPYGQAIYLPAILDWVGWRLVEFDAKYGWNFGQDERAGSADRMPDQYEDMFLYAFGHSKAREILTGELDML